jgi:hypothetical protein
MLAAPMLALYWAQAEPAPAEPPPAGAPMLVEPPPAPPEPDNAFGVYGGVGFRPGDAGRTVGPRFGPAVGGAYRRRYLTVGGDVDLGAGVDFFYDQFQTSVTGSAMTAPGQESPYAAERTTSDTSFAAIQTATARLGRARPFIDAGIGGTIAYFSTPELAFRPGSLHALQPFLRGSAGLNVVVYRGIGVSARVGYSHVLTRPTLTTSGSGTGAPTTYAPFGDFVDAGLGVVLPF